MMHDSILIGCIFWARHDYTKQKQTVRVFLSVRLNGQNLSARSFQLWLCPTDIMRSISIWLYEKWFNDKSPNIRCRKSKERKKGSWPGWMQSLVTAPKRLKLEILVEKRCASGELFVFCLVLRSNHDDTKQVDSGAQTPCHCGALRLQIDHPRQLLGWVEILGILYIPYYPWDDCIFTYMKTIKINHSCR